MDETSSLPYAHGGPVLRGTLRTAPEDFFVDEQLGFEPDGEGEHVFVRVEKRGANTDWVARQIARHAGVDAAAVSYAGMKDRNAVTRQTFSLHLPGKSDPDWSTLESPEFRVLSAARHRRKLQRGALEGNTFRIVVRDIEGDPASAELRLAEIRSSGVPNYFGEQRFGRGEGNLVRAQAMFAGRRVARHERGILLSAARSHLFNLVLGERVRRGDWNRDVEGDVWMLSGSQSIFGPEPLSEELRARLACGDIAPTGPLWGAGDLRTSGAPGEIERNIGTGHEPIVRGLSMSGLRQERRTLVLRAPDITSERLSARELVMSFSLNKGSYATVVIREIIESTSVFET